MELLNNPAFTGLAGAAISAVLVYLAAGKKLRIDDQSGFRESLLKELNGLKGEMKGVYAEMGSWREKYYKEVETSNALRAENSFLQNQVKEMKEDLELVKQTALDLEHKVDKNNDAGK